eukprot:scaffold46038_cov63-Phaeocystis_antarctica.AAC.2
MRAACCEGRRGATRGGLQGAEAERPLPLASPLGYVSLRPPPPVAVEGERRLPRGLVAHDETLAQRE